MRECEPQVKFNTQPQLWLEIALLGLSSLGGGKGDDGSGRVGERESGGKSPPHPLTLSPPQPLATTYDYRELNLESMWREVMERQAPALKALLQQHAQLVSFDGKSADLKVMSKPLKQRVENSLSFLQTTFSQITGKQISVVLS